MKNIPGLWMGGLLAVLISVLLAAGCARTPPVRFYQLSAMEAAAGSGASSAGEPGAVLGIGPVRLPQYLDRPQLVTRLTSTRLHLADSHRWAEPLAENIARVMGENLSLLLGSERIRLHPWPASAGVEYQLLIEVLHFENESDGSARLAIRWSVRGRDGNSVLPQRQSEHLVAATRPDQEGQVEALSQALRIFSREIAEALRPKL